MFEKCNNSIVCFSRAKDRKKFLRWVTLDYQKMKDEASLASANEFVTCLKIAEERKIPIATRARVLQGNPL